jgi:hypothetical protein
MRKAIYRITLETNGEGYIKWWSILVEMSISRYEDRAGWYSSITLKLHLKGAQFKSQPGHWLPRQTFFLWFSSVPPAKCWNHTLITPWLLPINYSSIVLRFNTICSKNVEMQHKIIPSYILIVTIVRTPNLLSHLFNNYWTEQKQAFSEMFSLHALPNLGF